MNQAIEGNTTLTPALITLGHDLLAFKQYYVGIAAVLAYDYCLTIGQELEFIWTGKRSPIFYLYVTNRYCPIAFCFITLFEWIQTLLIIIPAEAVLVLRTFALTNRSKPILGILTCVMMAQCSIVFFAISQTNGNHALQTPSGIADEYHVCILFSDPRMETAYLALSILFDFTVFSLTVIRILSVSPTFFPNTVLLRTILRDGIFSFCIILSGNCIWMICALVARPSLKLINAQPSMVAGHSEGTVIDYEWSQDFTTESIVVDNEPVFHDGTPLTHR
ncbi:hypothetical protein B0H34DRAFT_675415 [Crassisporium funariophilum]|nr:hypothetical protein B0H34DRAFT_675415 [Crassisporium funariophilum]